MYARTSAGRQARSAMPVIPAPVGHLEEAESTVWR